MDTEQNKKLFEELPVEKAVGVLTLPAVISSLVMVIYSLADTYFVGLLNNPVETAAVTLASPLLLAFNAVNNLFGIGCSTMMSRALGRGDYDTVKKTSSFGFYCSFISGLCLSLLCLLFLNPVLNMLGAEPSTAETTAGYVIWTVVFGASPAILNVVLAYLVKSEGAAVHASIGTMSGCLLNLVLDPVFIMPWGFSMGAAGAGAATFLSNCTACIYFLILLKVKKGRTFVSVNPKDFCIRRSIVSEVFGVGVPASVQNLLNVTGLAILNNLAAAYGTSAVAAVGIARKIDMIPEQIAIGGTWGVLPLLSYTYSSKKYTRMERTVYFIGKIMIPFMVISAVVFWLGAVPLVSLFTRNSEVIHYGKIFLRGFSLAMPFFVADYLSVGFFQSIGMGSKSLILAVFRKIIFEIPAMFLMNRLFGAGGLSLGMAVTEVFVSVIGISMMRSTMNKIRQGGEKL